MNELSTVARKHVPAIAAAIKSLDLLDKQIGLAKTYAELRGMMAEAEAIRLLGRDIEAVRDRADDVITDAQVRISEEIEKTPKARGGGQLGKNGNAARGKSIMGRAATGIPSSTRRRYKVLRENKDRLPALRAQLRKEGKEATATALVKAITQANKHKHRAKRERMLGAKQRALPDKRYGVIYADPPWRFTPYSDETGMDRAADNHYPTMNVDQIIQLAVPAADDCVLFLWSTVPMLVEALAVLGAWGFSYKSHFVWIKDKPGTGFWTRNQHELLLIGTKGKIPAPAHGEQFASALTAPRLAHSAKPFKFREMIEEMFPTLPRIELFAREQLSGWDVWGNEVTSEAAE
jgi:N6-adenosine-specific RNA methylase IME4